MVSSSRLGWRWCILLARRLKDDVEVLWDNVLIYCISTLNLVSISRYIHPIAKDIVVVYGGVLILILTEAIFSDCNSISPLLISIVKPSVCVGSLSLLVNDSQCPPPLPS